MLEHPELLALIAADMKDPSVKTAAV